MILLNNKVRGLYWQVKSQIDVQISNKVRARVYDQMWNRIDDQIPVQIREHANDIVKR